VISDILEYLDRYTTAHQYTGIVLLGDFNQLKEYNIVSFPLKQVVKPIVLPPVGKSDHNVVGLLTTERNI